MTTTATTAPIRVRPRSTTRRTLLRFRAALLIATITVFASSLWAFRDVHGTANVVHSRTAPAILELTVARAALVRADRAAITSFGSGESRLAGPGDEYQNQIAIASQNLTQVAEDNVAGPTGSGTLQLIQGLLVAYTSLIGQADAHFRSGETTLGVTDLWYASRLQHAPGSGILAQVDSLLAAQEQALAAQVSGRWQTWLATVAWILSVAVLLGLLGVVLRFLSRRFRRTVNRFLAAAMVFLLGMVAVNAFSVAAQHRLNVARDTVDRVVNDWRVHVSETDMAGQQALSALVRKECGGVDGCGRTVAGFIDGVDRTTGSAGSVDDNRLTAGARDVNERSADAGDNAWLEILIYVLAAFTAGCVLFGLHARLDEYRYRSQ